MRKEIKKYKLLWALLIAFSSVISVRGQNGGLPAGSLRVFTDRNLYISGEPVRISGFILSDFGPDLSEGSKVIYHELIRPDGTSISAGKFPVVHSFSEACLIIPEETISGYYYLKSYTKWMRNGKPEDYSFILLKIINPFSSEVLKNDEENASISKNQIQADSSRFLLNSGKTSYLAGEEVRISVKKLDNKADLRICLSVVPEGTAGETEIFSADKPENVYDPDSIFYVPETRGISLTGRLAGDTGGAPVPNALVNLSVIGDKDVMAIRTDSSGRFFFALPEYFGNRDLFLCAEDRQGSNSLIYIDNDFCTKPVSLPSPVFQLSSEEKEIALKMAVNEQITKYFFPDKFLAVPDTVVKEVPFYGKPDEVLDMEKFIDLPTIEEYFSELVGAVNVRKFEGRKVFRFNSPKTEMLIFDPLILIDWVAVDDIERILAMAPRAIERIELVNAPYIKGNITYGGIISFVSRKGDFAGIDLPSSGTFVNYQFFNNNKEYREININNQNLPDSRNTIFWDPSININEEGLTSVTLKAPATPGKYYIIIQGIDINSGDYIYQKKEFKVNGK